MTRVNACGCIWTSEIIYIRRISLCGVVVVVEEEEEEEEYFICALTSIHTQTSHHITYLEPIRRDLDAAGPSVLYTTGPGKDNGRNILRCRRL
jgi:hypothetical protein